MKFKYEKEVDKLIKLIYDYWIKEKITKKDLDSNFSFALGVLISPKAKQHFLTNAKLSSH